jgi:two-component system, OmpR family, sensor histidine kinase KdpD
VAIPDHSRPDPERLLKQAMAEERGGARERLKISLGYASGVGKSFRMLDEARRRRERGQDVVVGAVQPKRSAEIEALLRTLEVIPPKIFHGMETIDVERILRRRPRVCIIDGLAYDNPPGSRHAHRWQDVEELVENGITVITSVNLQYIEEERERVEAITGKHVTQTVPKAFLYGADEIVVVDVPSEMLLERTAGAADPSDEMRRLSELREIALLVTADVVDRQLEAYLEMHAIDQHWGAHERILICITPRANATRMITCGKHAAERFHGDLMAAYVQQPELSAGDQQALGENLAAARDAGAEIAVLDGEDFVATIVKHARAHRITQIFIGHSLRQSWWDRLTGGPVDRLIRAAEGMDVRVFPH